MSIFKPKKIIKLEKEISELKDKISESSVNDSLLKKEISTLQDNIVKSSSNTDIIINEVDGLKEIITKGVTNDSLIGFNSGNVTWYNNGGTNSYSSHYVIYKGIDMLASLGAELPVNIYRGDTLMPKDFKFPGGFSINRPHPNMSLLQVLYTALIYFFYRGEFMIEISDDPFLHLIPINPKYMTRITNTMDWKYSYNSIHRTILEENLIYVPLFNPDNESRGLSPVDVVKADLLNETSAIAYNTKFFENFGQIGGFFYDSEGKAKAVDMKTIVDQFDYLHKGVNKSHKTLGLPGGIRYEEFAQTMRELQYLESRKDIRDRILAVLGIHKAIFGVTDSVDRSLAEEGVRMLWKNTLKSKMIMIQEKINQVLFRRLFPGFTFKYDFSAVAELREAIESVMKQVTLYQQLGYTTNEINERFDLGMEDMTDARGEMRLVPTGYVPAEDFMYDDKETSTKKEDTKSLKVLDEFFIEEKTIRVNKARYIRKYNILVRNTSKQMAGKLGKFFSKELGMVVKSILQYDQIKSNIDMNTLLSEIQNMLTLNKSTLEKTMEPLYREGSLGADRLVLETIVATTVEPTASEIVVASLTNKISNISNHTYRLIKNQIKDGVNAGDSIEMISKRVTKVYKMNSSRSRIIARTEAGNVIHNTTDERYRKEGVQKKEWIDTSDGKVRASHAQNAAMGVVAYDFVYNNGQRFPNDGSGSAADNISCRCTFAPVIT